MMAVKYTLTRELEGSHGSFGSRSVNLHGRCISMLRVSFQGERLNKGRRIVHTTVLSISDKPSFSEQPPLSERDIGFGILFNLCQRF
jgi:hypothetical protein